MDVRCGCERLRYDLKNPSTTVGAESSQRSALLFDRRPRSARAGRKWSTKSRTTSTAHPSVSSTQQNILQNIQQVVKSALSHVLVSACLVEVEGSNLIPVIILVIRLSVYLTYRRVLFICSLSCAIPSWQQECSLFRSDYFPVTFAFWLHILRLHIRDVPSLLLPPGLGEYWSGIVLNDVGNDTCWGTCEVYHLFYHTLVIAFACNSRLMSFLNPLSLPTFSLWSVSIQSLGDGCMAYASLHGVASCHACHRASRRGRATAPVAQP